MRYEQGRQEGSFLRRMGEMVDAAMTRHGFLGGVLAFGAGAAVTGGVRKQRIAPPAKTGSKNANAGNLFKSPDEMMFDSNRLLWMQTDGDGKRPRATIVAIKRADNAMVGRRKL
jgi:secreted PhoX family phosphatase